MGVPWTTGILVLGNKILIVKFEQPINLNTLLKCHLQFVMAMHQMP